MSARAVTIVDTGGNVGSVERALSHLGAEVTRTRDAERIAGSRSLVLPGVGAFSAPRAVVRGAIEEAIHTALDEGAWLLGICVGFQLLFDASEEFGEHDGLGLLPGRVTQLPSTVQLPHIGWNLLEKVADHPLLAGIPNGGAVYQYFVHSFAPDQVPDEVCFARATHGRSFPALACRGRVMGVQFHPEKSGPVGLQFLSNFLRLEEARGRTAGH
jgi:glutamine amidotransferase